jgi:chromosome segregation ATPase
MGNDMLALVGEVVETDDPRDTRIEQLEREARTLRRSLADAELQASRAREDADRALSRLRTQLSPLYRALQAVFGELDAAGVTEDARTSVAASGAAVPSGADPRVAAVWEAWKSRLGGGCAKVIDALLLHSDLNTQQLAIAIGLHRTTIPALIHKLNKAGLINKNGGRFSLKQL